jgi:hypothetical protein
VAGTSKWAIQPANKALAQSAAEMEVRGTAFCRLEIRSITVPVPVYDCSWEEAAQPSPHVFGQNSCAAPECWLAGAEAVDLAPLAEQAVPSHQSDGLGHLWPAKSGCDEAPCSPHTMKMDGVQRLENRLTLGSPVWEKWTQRGLL